MKKIITIILLVIMVISFVACDKQEIIVIGPTIDPSHIHSYTNYKCAECGTVDKTHAYEYLVEWVKENGVVIEDDISIFFNETENVTYELGFNTTRNFLYAMTTNQVEGGVQVTMLRLDTFQYASGYLMHKIAGVIDPKTFNSGATLTYTEYEGTDGLENDMLLITKIALVGLLSSLQIYLSSNNIGVYIDDLGFKEI